MKLHTKAKLSGSLIARILSLSALAFLMFASGCKKDPVYSCNPELNKWTIKNAARFVNYNREQLAAISSLDTQHAIYVSLPADSKYNLWKEKFQLVQKTMGLTNEENMHIQKFLDYAKPAFWTSNETLDQFAPWADNWGKEALTQYGWDSTKFFLIAETWLMPNELQQIADRYNNEPVHKSAGDAPGCTCRYTVACQWFVQSCSGTCVQNVYSCGIFGSSRCTGVCESSGGGLSNQSPTKPEGSVEYYIH